MQSILIISPDTLSTTNDITRPLLNSESNGLYHLYFNETIESKYDFVVFSAHDPSGFLYRKKASIILSIISYVPSIDSDTWASFYTNICLADVIVIDRYNLNILNGFAYPKKKVIVIDGSHIPYLPVRQATYTTPYSIYNVDPVDKRLWEKFVEYAVKEKDANIKIAASPEEAQVVISMNPLGYGLTYSLVNSFPFFMTAYEEESSLMLDARCIHHLDKRLGNIIEIKGSAYTPQIKSELNEFTETLCTLLEHLNTTPNKLQRYYTSQTLVDRIFHQLNSIYKS